MRASSLVLVSLFVAACGQPPSYKLVDVPHCQVPEGQVRSGFAERVRWLYNNGGSMGEGPVAGEWPSLGIGVDDSLPSKEVVLAVVSCPNGNPKEGANRGKELTASKVPDVCPGQQVLYHGTLKATDDATAKERGFAGVLKFPEVPLTCPVGTLARTTSADIKPLAK